MLGNRNIRTSAGEAKCMLVRFEHAVYLVEPTRCGTIAEVPYEVEYAHL